MKRTIILPRPHPAQQEILDNPARFKVIAAGRQFGKTELGILEILRGISRQRGLYWWVGLSWKSASMKRAWRVLRRRLRDVAVIREADKEIHLPDGSQIWLRSAENPESIAGEGIRGMVMDEWTLMQERVWTEFVRATLMRYGGWGLFIGVPKGRNWAWQMYESAKSDSAKGTWAAWSFPSSSNPHIAAAEIEAIRARTTERMFQQEYMAEFLADGAGVFRRVMEAATATPQDKRIEANPETKTRAHDYVFGVDWGKQNDFTVITVLDLSLRAIVAIDRFNQIDYTLQRARLRALYERFLPMCIIAESNSMGEPIIEQLCCEGLPVDPFLTSNATKAQAIEAVALAFERGDLKIINDPTLIGELLAYESERLPSGLTRYGAPAGMHDDCVMSAALAWTQAGPQGQRTAVRF